MNKLQLQGNLNVQGDLRFSDNTGIPTLPKFGVAAAYSVRKLFNDYTGYAMRVRRSTDNTELDIGFTNFNKLDETSIISFCGGIGTVGTVVAWYDQSDNGYTAGVNNIAYGVGYPVIYTSGAISRLLESNGAPAIGFNSNSGLICNTTSPNFDFNSVFVTECHNNSPIDSKNQRIYSKRNSDLLLSVLQPGAGSTQNNYIYKRGNASCLSVTTQPTAFFLNTKNIIDVTNATAVNADIRGNNALQPATAFPLGAPQNNANFALGIGTNVNNVPPSGGNYFSGRMSELIIYNTDMREYRQSIINNMDYYYNTF
jgi:hypothetical protein